ncbi:hypothetical protein CCR91_02825 [Thiorhodovibrio winogradskyi]|nr:hypothetical protein [Thiorhodovibrio winogradskyi]
MSRRQPPQLRCMSQNQIVIDNKLVLQLISVNLGLGVEQSKLMGKGEVGSAWVIIHHSSSIIAT